MIVVERHLQKRIIHRFVVSPAEAGEVLRSGRAAEVVVPRLVRQVQVARCSIAACRSALHELVRLRDAVDHDGQGRLRGEPRVAIPVQVGTGTIDREIDTPVTGLSLRQGAVEGQVAGDRRAVVVEVDLPSLRHIGRRDLHANARRILADERDARVVGQRITVVAVRIDRARSSDRSMHASRGGIARVGRSAILVVAAQIRLIGTDARDASLSAVTEVGVDAHVRVVAHVGTTRSRDTSVVGAGVVVVADQIRLVRTHTTGADFGPIAEVGVGTRCRVVQDRTDTHVAPFVGARVTIARAVGVGGALRLHTTLVLEVDGVLAGPVVRGDVAIFWHVAPVVGAVVVVTAVEIDRAVVVVIARPRRHLPHVEVHDAVAIRIGVALVAEDISLGIGVTVAGVHVDLLGVAVQRTIVADVGDTVAIVIIVAQVAVAVAVRVLLRSFTLVAQERAGVIVIVDVVTIPVVVAGVAEVVVVEVFLQRIGRTLAVVRMIVVVDASNRTFRHILIADPVVVVVGIARVTHGVGRHDRVEVARAVVVVLVTVRNERAVVGTIEVTVAVVVCLTGITDTVVVGISLVFVRHIVAVVEIVENSVVVDVDDRRLDHDQLIRRVISAPTAQTRECEQSGAHQDDGLGIELHDIPLATCVWCVAVHPDFTCSPRLVTTVYPDLYSKDTHISRQQNLCCLYLLYSLSIVHTSLPLWQTNSSYLDCAFLFFQRSSTRIFFKCRIPYTCTIFIVQTAEMRSSKYIIT